MQRCHPCNIQLKNALNSEDYKTGQQKAAQQDHTEFFCRILAIVGHIKNLFSEIYFEWEKDPKVWFQKWMPCMPCLLSWAWNSLKPSTNKTEICSWPFLSRQKINDNRLADFDGFVIQSKSFKQTHLCNGSHANITQSSPTEVPIGNSLSISPQSFYTQPKDSDKLSLSLQRLVKYVMNKSVTSNSKLTFCFDCCRILYPWQLFSTQNRLEKWSVYLNSRADGGKCFFLK